MMDHNASYVLWAFAITWTVLGAYLVYVRSRLNGVRQRLNLHQVQPARPEG